MENVNTDALKELEYAHLSTAQEQRLREFEKQFNEEFGKSCYFIAMDR
jgi:hypothetical protein